MHIRIRTFFSLVLLLGAGLSLGGCSLWGAGKVAMEVIPVVRAIGAGRGENSKEERQKNEDKYLVVDEGRSWSREVIPTEGSTGQVLWTVPFQAGQGVRAMAALAPMECRIADVRQTRWLVRDVESGNIAGEAWYVNSEWFEGAIDARGQWTIGLKQADLLASQLGVGGHRRISWLMVVPGSGKYELMLLWEATDPTSLALEKPCVSSWTWVPLELALQATARQAPREGAPSPSQTVQRQRPTSSGNNVQERSGGSGDAGVSLGELRNAGAREEGARENVLESVEIPRGESSLASSKEEFKTTWRLLGIPEYDLVRLHQIALQYEVAYDKSSYRADQMDMLNSWREQMLNHFTSGEGTETTLCRMIWSHKLKEKSLSLWGGESTIPEGTGESCLSN